MTDEQWIAPAQLAIRSDRGLQERHEQLIDQIAERFVLLLRSFGIHLSDEQLFRKSRTLILVLDSYMLSLQRVSLSEHALIQKEFEEVVFAFLEKYVPETC